MAAVLQEQSHAGLIRLHLVENERNGARGRRQVSPLHPNIAPVLKKDAFWKGLFFFLKTINKHYINDFNKISPIEKQSLINKLLPCITYRSNVTILLSTTSPLEYLLGFF